MKREHVKNLPKIELHCHLDGSIRPETLRKIADQQGISLPVDNKKLKELLVAPIDCQDLNDYLERFDLVLTCLQTEEALKTAAIDVISQAAEENIQYIEVRFAPSLHTEKGLSLPKIITAVLAGLEYGQQQFGVKSNALLCGMRHEELADIEKVVRLAEEFKTNGIVGFDLAGNEIDFPPYTFEETLNLVDHLNIPLTLHAGECGCGKNVADAIHLGAKRIGHGIALKDTPEYFSLLQEKDTLIEMCPTSNFQTKTVTHLADYPFKTFLDNGIKICINTDNRTVSDTTLTDEFMKLHEWYGITYADMEQLNHNAVAGAFISENEKQILHEQLTNNY
ncbi:adenosine deaminase [Enterococcus haemoperoxidus ATCC BAA-382]|uniref:Adenosine deaminase n=1 Tax=Enterococcus haemoperoxidus ATCC BAA-382 TaxID=1158608 RepID=R2SZW7_9ENTE|nr:adenosine deaminase [Enterococcus haemoperoxidus]EOH98331.1 adenosine deaminase [Enterococcus haemoperoxidus ATCC BAA-382]EOT59844.1 adenosine deaminase [Enterococcus haemoperoxidus ATCC BAA-382]OJG56026.1 adenosine deaminase [Enterococcus haemoperoxidus]